MLNRIGYGKGIVVFEPEPPIKIGGAYQPQHAYYSPDQEWLNTFFYGPTSYWETKHMDSIWAIIFLLGFVVLIMGG